MSDTKTLTGSGTMINKLTEGPVLSQLIRFAIPFMLANLLQTLYNLADMVVVGHYVGSAGLSAVSIGGNVTMLMLNLGLGLATGGQILIAQLVGAGEEGKLKRAAGTLISIVAFFGLIVMILGATLSTPILTAMNTPEEAMAQAQSYLTICSFGMIFVYVYNALCSILRGMGDSVRPLLFVAVTAVLNLGLDILFVGAFKMASAGAALATMISQIVASLAAVIFLYIKRDGFIPGFGRKNLVPDRKYTTLILRLGAPLSLMQCSVTLSFLFVNSYVNAYGLIASAVSGVGGRLNGIMSVVTSSFMASGSAMIGQNMGAGRTDRVDKIVRFSLVICLATFVIVAACSLLFPKQIFGIFNNEAEVLAMAPEYMRIAIITYLSFAMMAPFLGLINGVGFTSLNFIIALLDGVVTRISLSLFLAHTLDMGLKGFWLGSALAGFVSVFLAGAYYLTGRWKTRTILK